MELPLIRFKMFYKNYINVSKIEETKEKKIIITTCYLCISKIYMLSRIKKEIKKFHFGTIS